MSDELDKFVLQYTVDMKDAISRLEQLNQKIEKTGKNSKSVGGEIKDFASGAADEIGKLVPGIDKVSVAIKALGAEFAVAGLAVGALAVGVKSVIDMRNQYNQQRKEGMEVGVSSLRLEEYQRKFAKSSNGNITREQTAAEVKKLADFSSAVFRDPTKIGTEARTAKRLGINMGLPEQHIGVNALLTQLGDKFSKLTDAQVQASAKTLGMNQDFALSLKKQGAGVGTVTELTSDEITSREAAQQQLTKFNDAMAKLGENFKKAENALGEQLIPAFTTFVELMVKLTDALPKNMPAIVKGAGTALKTAVPGAGAIMGAVDTVKSSVSAYDWLKGKIGSERAAKVSAGAKAAMPDTSVIGSGISGSSGMGLYGWLKEKIAGKKEVPGGIDAASAAVAAAKDAAVASAKGATVAAEGSKANATSAKDITTAIEEQDKINEESQRMADQNALAINQFAGSVASFANAVDEKQAWAAWAGEIGKASGLSPSIPPKGTPQDATAPTATTRPVADIAPDGTRQANPVRQVGKTDYDDTFAAAGKKYGLDPNLLKNIARVESRFDPNAVSKKGATGLMQIMPSNFKSLGITDAKDPTQNIMGAANLFSQFLKRAKGDVELALRYYNGGFDRSKWGAENASYANKVLGGSQTAGTSGQGETRSKIQLKSVQNTIAQRLGVPVQQLQMGGVNRGDVSFASSQIQSGIQNQIFDLKNQLKAVNLPRQTMSKLMSELRAQESGLAMMRQYSAQVVDKQQAGERSITIGERAIVINVNGAADPIATAEAVRLHLNDHIGELVNGTSTIVKR